MIEASEAVFSATYISSRQTVLLFLLHYKCCLLQKPLIHLCFVANASWLKSCLFSSPMVIISIIIITIVYYYYYYYYYYS